MSNQFGLAGAQPQKPTRYAPIYNARYTTGYWSNRSPLRDAATSRDTEKYYGPAGDALIAGLNVEISSKLTLIRRPGNSVFNTTLGVHAIGSTPIKNVDRFYDFHLFGPTTEQILVMMDTATALYSINTNQNNVLNPVWFKSPGAGQTYMQSVGNTLYFANGVDNKKWLQSLLQWTPNTQINTPFMSTFLIDINGNIQQLTQTGIPINSVFVQSDVVQVFANVAIGGVIVAGDQITFPSGMAASFLDGQTITVLVAGDNNFTFNFITANYPQTGETNKVALVYPGDGTPITGPSQPIWSTTVPSATNNFQGGTTQDGTAIWTNRGNPVENWGIKPPTRVLTPFVHTTTNVWAANTYYSLVGAVIDTNGNLQQVSVPGLSGASTPNWSTVLGGVTYDGAASTGVTWKMVASAAMMVWQPSTFYPTGSFLIENASGTNCLFQLGAPTTPYLSGTVSAYLFPHSHSGDVGDFDLPYPTTLGASVASAAGLSGFNFTIAGTGTGGSINWNTIDATGATTGTTQPFAGQDVSDLNIIVTGTIEVPVAGAYTFSVTHGDGLVWGIGGGALFVSGTTPVNVGATNTAANGYPVFPAGHNVNVTLNAGNAWVDTYTVEFLTPGTYGVEMNLARWDKPNAQLIMTCNGHVLPSAQPSGGGVSGTVTPTWPAWTTADAPSYPNVTESSGRLQWNNIGPATDFVWHAAAHFTLPDTTIVDPNSNLEGPYETGLSGSSAPSFATGLNALTNDNPNLIWINRGGTSAPPVGTVSTFNGGWVYSISLVNTLDDTVSNATRISKPTGNFTGAQGVILAPGDGLQTITIDPQADYVAIWRSTDGLTTPFLIPGPNDYPLPITIPLSQYLTEGYTDTTPDTGLNNLISAPLAGENTPPVPGAGGLVLHLGRLFYYVGNIAKWTAGPDTPAGNGLNGSNPLAFDQQGALVKRIVPLTVGAVVFTVSDINIILGDGTASNPIQPSKRFVEGVGLLSYNAMDVNGSIIGFFSTDHQFIVLDPNGGVSTFGGPIQDQLKLNNGQPGQSWDPSKVYVAWHVNGEDQAWYLADGVNGWYRLMTTPAPDTGLAWSPFAKIVPGCKAVQSIEVTPGNHKLLLGPVGTGQVLQRDDTINNDGGQVYPANAVFGSAVLAQPGQTAVVKFITVESVGVGTPIVLGVLIDEALPFYDGNFDFLKHWTNDPPNLRPSRSIPAQRFYLSEDEDSAAECRHLQIMVSWAAEDVPNQLLTTTIFGGYLQEG